MLPPKIAVPVGALPRRSAPLRLHQPGTVLALILGVFHYDPGASAFAQPTRLTAGAPLGPLAHLAIVYLLDGFVFLLPIDECQLLQQPFTLLVLELLHLLLHVVCSVVLVQLKFEDREDNYRLIVCTKMAKNYLRECHFRNRWKVFDFRIEKAAGEVVWITSSNLFNDARRIGRPLW